MKKVLNKNNLIFILILMTLFNLMMPNISYAATVSINDQVKETIAGWYMILRGLVIGALLILLLVLVIKAAITSSVGDKAILKRMLIDWCVALLLVLFIHYLMIFAINLNENLVADAEKMGQKISGMAEGQEISLYESAITKAYEIKFLPGTIGMILYMMLVYYAYKFTFIYLKRYVNVIVLILIAPVVCGVYAFKKVLTGKSITLKKWIKEFIYNVFLQTLHALMYGSLVGLVLKYSDDSESFIGAILAMIIFAVIFKVDKVVRKAFNSVGGDTSVAVSKIESASKNVLNATKQVAGSKIGSAMGDSSKIGGYLTNKFGEDVSPKIITNSIKTEAKAGWLDVKSDFRGGVNELKELKNDIGDSFSGKINKVVSEEAIAKEKEKMENAGFFGKTWLAILKSPKNISEKIDKVKARREELKIYLEDKKTKSIEYIKKLQKDAEAIRSIPQLVKNARKHPESIIVRNPETGEIKLDERYLAVLNLWDTKELEERLKILIRLSFGDIDTAVILAQGYEALLRCPKLGMLLLAEDNYKKMVHPPIPVEERKTISGYDKKVTPKLRFKTFESVEFEKIIVQSTRESFQGIATLEKVSKGIRNQTITYRKIDENEDRTVIHYKGKSTSCRKLNTNSKLVLESLRGFCSDAQIARNISLLEQLQRIQGEEKLTNLSPELLVILEQTGVVRKIESGPEQGGYVILDQAIENVVLNKKVNDFLATNEDNPLAQKINQFLSNNPDNEMAIKIANFVIDNPDNELSVVLDRIEVTETGVVSYITTDIMPEQVKIESLDGVVGEVTASKGEVQIFVDGIGEELGEIPVQVTRSEDGSIQLINSVTFETIPVAEDAIIQIITPEESTLQVINLAENTIQTAKGEDALQILRDKGIEIDEQKFKIKQDLTEIAATLPTTNVTTATEDTGELQFEVEVLTALVQQEIIRPTEEVTEEERLGKLNDLLSQIAEHQGEQALLDALAEESSRVDEKVEEFVYAVNPKQETLKHLDYLSEDTETTVKDRYTAEDLAEVVESLQESTSDFVLDMSLEGDDISSEFESILDAIRNDDLAETTYREEKQVSLADEYDSLFSSIMEGLEPEEKIAAAVSSITPEEKDAISIDEEFEALKNAIILGMSDDETDSKPKNSWAKPAGSTSTKKGKKGKKDEKAEPPVKIKFNVEGAVKKPGEYWLTKGNKIYQAIKLAGGFAKNADQESISDRLNEIIDENNTFIRIPVMTEEKLRAQEKSKGKDSKTGDNDKDKNKIECIITGAVANPGKKTLEKGSTVADLIVAAGRLTDNANRQAIMLNGERTVGISDKLSNNDKIFIPKITEDELDARKGYDTKYIKYIMETELEEHKKRVGIESIDKFRRNKGAVHTFSKRVSKTLADKGIKMSFDEVERRVELFLKRESEKELKKSKSATDNLLKQINVVKKSQVEGRKKEFVERLDTRNITLNTKRAKAQRVAEHIEQVDGIRRTEGVTS